MFMTRKHLTIVVLAGYILCASTVSVSATCDELRQCLSNIGISLSSLQFDGEHPEEFFDLLCQSQTIISHCDSKFEGCSTYEAAKIAIDSFKEQTNSTSVSFICDHTSVYAEATTCAKNIAKELTPSDMAQSLKCADQEEGSETSDTDCQALTREFRCDKATRLTYRCIAKLMVLAQENGFAIPCMDIYKAAHMTLAVGPTQSITQLNYTEAAFSSSSRNKPGACALLLFFSWFISKFANYFL